MIPASFRCDWCKFYFAHPRIIVGHHFYACSVTCAKALKRRTNPNRPSPRRAGGGR